MSLALTQPDPAPALNVRDALLAERADHRIEGPEREALLAITQAWARHRQTERAA
jgi:hypothetical protein